METPRQNGIAWRITNSLSPFARSQQKLQGCTCSTRNTGAWPEQKSKLETKKSYRCSYWPPLPSPPSLSTPHTTLSLHHRLSDVLPQPRRDAMQSQSNCRKYSAIACSLPTKQLATTTRANHGYWNRRSIYRLSGLLVPGDPTKIYIFVIRPLSIIHIANLKRTWKRSGFLRYMSKDLIFVFLLGHVLQFLKNRKYETNKCNLASKDHVSIFCFIIIMWNIHNS